MIAYPLPLGYSRTEEAAPRPGDEPLDQHEVDLAACIAGSKHAWDAFVDRYARVIYAAVRKVIGTSRPLDDPVQEVFVRLVRDDFRLLRTFDPKRASLTTWVTLIARSTAIDFVRKRRLATVPIADYDAPAPAPEEVRSLPEIPYHLLSGRQRLVVRMMFEESMSVPEIAVALEVDDQTVRSTKHKALSRLREHFRTTAPGMFVDPAP